QMMLELHQQHPEYGFDRHKGYPTKLHFEMLKKYGVLEQHRRSFRPVRKALDNEKS
ncbi:MAG: ribonuclease HII, partial [Gammaproteobacteria bacterium]|nr:ribonuclease HII [Gammaproteobacteria bacterium]